MTLLAAFFATTLLAAGALDPDFKDRALTHVRQLAALGNRVAGSESESKAARYIREQMEKAGLRVAVEPFEFQSFVLESAVLKVGDEKAEILKLDFNSYSDGGRRTGGLAFVESTGDLGAVLKMELDDKIVVTAEGANLDALSLFKRPRAVVCLSRPDFQRISAGGSRSGEVISSGRLVKTNSANIVGTLSTGTEPGREIILSAHYDSWKGPGANDNASGVAVLLELARHFRALESPPAVSMRFVAFGAEELGMLGAKAYLEKHQAELRNCQLLFNMDTVGGDGAIYAETRGGVGGVPEWLRDAVADAGKELGREIRSSNNMGSDHRVFIQAGVVATNIAISGAASHTPADVPESVRADSLEAAARIVSSVVEKTMRSGN